MPREFSHVSQKLLRAIVDDAEKCMVKKLYNVVYLRCRLPHSTARQWAPHILLGLSNCGASM